VAVVSWDSANALASSSSRSLPPTLEKVSAFLELLPLLLLLVVVGSWYPALTPTPPVLDHTKFDDVEVELEVDDGISSAAVAAAEAMED
jgi:hypothetical protein